MLALVRVRLISPEEQPHRADLIATGHYLRNASHVGEQLRHVITDTDGQWLAPLGWSAAALRFATPLAARLWNSPETLPSLSQ